MQIDEVLEPIKSKRRTKETKLASLQAYARGHASREPTRSSKPQVAKPAGAPINPIVQKAPLKTAERSSLGQT